MASETTTKPLFLKTTKMELRQCVTDSAIYSYYLLGNQVD